MEKRENDEEHDRRSGPDVGRDRLEHPFLCCLRSLVVRAGFSTQSVGLDDIHTAPPANPITALESIGPASATGKTVSLAKGTQGIFLIGPNGHTLYIFTTYRGTISACKKAGCAKTWPALSATGALKSGPGINAKEVKTGHGQVKRQVNYYGHLLYYVKGDASPGQTNGASVADRDLLGPFGNVMLPRS